MLGQTCGQPGINLGSVCGQSGLTFEGAETLENQWKCGAEKFENQWKWKWGAETPEKLLNMRRRNASTINQDAPSIPPPHKPPPN